LDAPTYPPATAFEQPVPLPYVLELQSVSIDELMKNPAAWTVVTKYLPSLEIIAGVASMKPHLSNMTVPSLSAFFRLPTPEVLASIDRELRQIPPLKDYSP
jgi:hypothetical protein